MLFIHEGVMPQVNEEVFEKLGLLRKIFDFLYTLFSGVVNFEGLGFQKNERTS